MTQTDFIEDSEQFSVVEAITNLQMPCGAYLNLGNQLDAFIPASAPEPLFTWCSGSTAISVYFKRSKTTISELFYQ